MSLPRPSGEIRTNYEGEESLFYTRRYKYASVLLMAAALAVPLVLSGFFLSIYQELVIFYIAALGLNLLTGNAGQISVGHAAVMGVGAYTVGLLETVVGVPLPFFVLVVVGGLVAAALGVLVGITARRLKGWYLLISTLAFQVIFTTLIETFRTTTGGVRGLQIPDPAAFGSPVGDTWFTLVIVALGILVTFLVANIRRSYLGRAFEAIGHRDIVAEVLGVNLLQYKIYAFVVAFFIGGLSGGLLAYSLGGIVPSSFDLFTSITLVGIILVGGLGRIKGAALGSLVFVLIPEALVSVAIRYGLPVGPLVRLVFAVIVIGFLLYEPRGLAKIWADVKEYLRAWPYRHF